MVDVSNIFYPTLTLPLVRGENWIFIVSSLYKRGNNVMNITGCDFSNIL
jgi:hypothetical protein